MNAFTGRPSLAQRLGRKARNLFGPFLWNQWLEPFAIGALFKLVDVFELDLLRLAYGSRGIGKYEDLEQSGERYLIEKVLPQLLPTAPLTFLDVGANEGSFAHQLRARFPEARLMAFEPNPASYQRLVKASEKLGFRAIHAAVGPVNGTASLYDRPEQEGTAHASLHRDVLTDLHLLRDVREYQVDVITLDTFTQKNGIQKVDFLKIDTEGHELEVLRGGTRLITEGRVSVIQFEFNEMNVISRCFLRDFYNLLPDYDIFRLDTNRLIPLGPYASINEVFQFHNLLALHRHIVPQ